MINRFTEMHRLLDEAKKRPLNDKEKQFLETCVGDLQTVHGYLCDRDDPDVVKVVADFLELKKAVGNSLLSLV